MGQNLINKTKIKVLYCIPCSQVMIKFKRSLFETTSSLELKCNDVT